MKKKKKPSMLIILLVFLIVESILAMYLSYEIRIGKSQNKPAVKIVSTVEVESRDFDVPMIGVDGEPVTDELGQPVMTTETQMVKFEKETEEPLKVVKLGNFMSFVDTEATTVNRIQNGIMDDMFPDNAIIEGEITGDDRYSLTYGSATIYNLFYSLFREKKPALDGNGNPIFDDKGNPVMVRNPMKFFGADTTVLNFRLIRMILYVDIFLILLALYINRSLSFIPSKIQIVYEMFYNFFDSLVTESLGSRAAKFLPFYITLFTYIWVCNWSGLLPIPGISEPTRNLNGTLGLGIMCIIMIQYYSLRKKGFKEWGKAYLEPFAPMLPLNIVGELSKVVSVSFRLFGNIFGGAIIFLVVSNLINFVVFPVALNMYFTMFSGTIQAFVFTMLTLTYLSLEITD